MSGQGPPGVPPAQGALNNTSYNVLGQQPVSRRVSSGASVNVCAVAVVRRLPAGKRANGLRRGIRGMGRGRGGPGEGPGEGSGERGAWGGPGEGG